MIESLDNTDPYASLKVRDFRWFVLARFAQTFAIQMQSLVVGWQVYQETHDALSLGLIGFCEAAPFLGIALVAGHVADVVSRKKIILVTGGVYSLCAATLLLISTELHFILLQHGVFPIYVVIFVIGLTRGFMSPAQAAFSSQLVPRALYGNASTWGTVSWQISEVVGPAVGGLVYSFADIGTAYGAVILLSAIGFAFFALIHNKPMPVRNRQETVMQSLSVGVRFVFRNQALLSAVTLDMFAVFFGGAFAVLPIFADKVLHVGPRGLGLLRASPAVGAIIISVVMANYPMFRKAGRNLFACVFAYGVMVIAFALSRNFYLSLAFLLLSGMFDNVSVVIRSTILQLLTPDEMRGRVSAVNGIFTGTSDGLGSFESGVAAKLLGLVPSVVFGGSMTLVTVAAVRVAAPELRTLKL
ncbi:MAG TPA: MFS transporter [Candidatus Kryptonia bacterium]